MKTLETLLLRLGFDELQSKIYSEVYFQGPLTVLEISSITGIKRPTVHFHVEQLLERKLLKAAVRQGRRVLVAESPEAFVTLVNEQKEQLQKTEHSLDRVIGETRSLLERKSIRGVSILVDEGLPSVIALYQEALAYGEVYSYIDIERSEEIVEVRRSLFDEALLQKKLDLFSEQYVTKSSDLPVYVKKLSVFQPFSFARTAVKLQGNIANILLFAGSVIMITKETDWKVMKLDQPLLVQFIKGLLQR